MPKYEIHGTARRIGALGLSYKFKRWIVAPTKEDAIHTLYFTLEHIHVNSVIEHEY